MWWKILLIIFAVIFLLLCLNIHIIVSYEKELSVKAGIGFIRLDILKLAGKFMGSGKKKKGGKDKKDKEPEKENKDKEDKKEKEPKMKKDNLFKDVKKLRGANGIIELISDLIALLNKTTQKFRKHLIFREVTVNYNVIGKDAADTALKFGRSSAVFFTNYGILCNLVSVKKSDIKFVPDYLGSKSNQKLVIHISYRILAILSLAVGALFGYLKVNSKHKSINERIKQKKIIKKQEQAV